MFMFVAPVLGVCLGALREMASDSGSCLCLSCDAGVILLAQHSTKASLALPSQQNNKHANQAKSSCHVVNGVGDTSWRPAEAFALRGGITNTASLEVGCGGCGGAVMEEEDTEHYSGGGGEEGIFPLSQLFCKQRHDGKWEWMGSVAWRFTRGCLNTFPSKRKEVCPPIADRSAKVCQRLEEHPGFETNPLAGTFQKVSCSHYFCLGLLWVPVSSSNPKTCLLGEKVEIVQRC